jgi:hypothetical protein
MPDWSIKIVPAGTGGGAAFVPDLKGAHPGDPLKAWQDDLVSWKNTTGKTHQIELVNVVWGGATPSTPPVFETKPIPAAGSSRPTYDVAQPKPAPSAWTVHYRCKLHPQEQGTIEATVYPTS